MAAPMSGRRLGMVVCLALVAAALGARPCRAIDVWMPETGEVKLDEVPRDSPEARFRHAAALIGGGEPMSAVGQLRGLIEQYPDEPWAERAGYLIACGLLAGGRYEESFEECEEFLAQYPEAEQEYSVRELQLNAATRRLGENLEAGSVLCDRLIADAPTAQFAARCQKEKADAIMQTKRFLLARDEYVAVLQYDPDSPWAPYVWYKIAECDLELAMWMDRGTEHLERARRAFRDFMEAYPEHNLAGQARERLAQARTEQASEYKTIAEYYLGPARRPAAALPYLHHIKTQFPETEEAQWAAEKIRQLIADPNVLVHERYKDVAVPETGTEGAADQSGQESAEQ